METTGRESPEGPPRRSDGLTSDGELALATFRTTWAGFRDAVDDLRTTGNHW